MSSCVQSKQLWTVVENHSPQSAKACSVALITPEELESFRSQGACLSVDQRQRLQAGLYMSEFCDLHRNVCRRNGNFPGERDESVRGHGC